MKLRVAGSSSAVPRPGRACSSYLIQNGGTNLVLDFGTGALQSLSRFIEASRIDAVVISHFHPDHFLDLVQLRYAIALDESATPITVYLPPQGTRRLERLAESIPSGTSRPFFADSLDLRDYDPNSQMEIGGLSLRFAPCRHYIEAYATRVSSGSAAIAYSADTAPCSSVTELARNADLFLCESALGADGQDRSTRGHSNAQEAGAMAREAAVKQLLLTHYSAKCNPEAMRAAAAQSFDGTVIVADDGLLLQVT